MLSISIRFYYVIDLTRIRIYANIINIKRGAPPTKKIAKFEIQTPQGEIE